MDELGLFTAALGLSAPWRVTRTEFDGAQLDLTLEAHSKAPEQPPMPGLHVSGRYPILGRPFGSGGDHPPECLAIFGLCRDLDRAASMGEARLPTAEEGGRITIEEDLGLRQGADRDRPRIRA
jgi:hypothetical protein